MRYEFDSYSKNVLIRNQGKGYFPEILYKGDRQWKVLAPSQEDEDELYTRAIWLGQGCWEDLDEVSEKEAEQILRDWGYEHNPPEADGARYE